MITDLLKNSYLYSPISTVFDKSFEFILQLNVDTPNGEYMIDEDVRAIVMEYETMEEFPFGWEAHQRFIDIQYCLRGKERIKWTPLKSDLVESESYNEEMDRTFYRGKGEKNFVDTGDGVFAVFFPNDAHAPQLMVSEPEFIKKVVVKVPVKSLTIASR